TGEGHGEWNEKSRFDVEDQKNDRVKIILRPELDPRFAERFHTAFVDRHLGRAWLWRLKKSAPHPSERERQQRKYDRDARENHDKQIRTRSHPVRNLINLFYTRNRNNQP